MRRFSLIASVLLGLSVFAVFSAASKNRTKTAENASISRLLFTETARYEPLSWLRGGERFPEGGELVIQDQTGRHRLVPEFAASVDGDVAFDGNSVVFSGREHAADPWQVYEVTLANGHLRRITQTPDDCIRPLYLPGGRVVYAHRDGARFVLETAALEDGKATRLSFAPGDSLPNDVLRDGRILFSAGYPLGSEEAAELYTVYSDGSGVEAYRCDHGRSRFAGKQINSGDILFTERRGVGRFTSALAEEEAVAVPEGDYSGGIAETAPGELLVSWRLAPGQAFVLKVWKGEGTGIREQAIEKANAGPSTSPSPSLSSGSGSGRDDKAIVATTLQAVVAPAGMSLVEPVVVAPRPVPNRHPSALHEWSYSNLLALNAAIHRGGRLDAKNIATVRLWTQAADGSTHLLGSSLVEKDGSFFIQVPGDTPLRFELLDASGKVIERERGWMWARGGEQRICVGCHAGPERAPDNAVPAVLLRSTEPVKMTGTVTSSAKGGR